MRHDCTAGLGDDVRFNQSLFFAHLLHGPDDAVGILLQAVVDRGDAVGDTAIVINPEPSAHVHEFNWGAEAPCFDIVVRGLLHCLLYTANFRHLAAYVEMEQLQRCQHSGVGQLIDGFKQFGCRQPKLGHITAGVVPESVAGRGQPAAQSDQGINADPSGNA